MRLTLLLLLLTISFTVKSQDDYLFRNYQVDDGLSHNTVFCALQSQDGFMWFGTKAGLNRFDGYKFKVYRYEQNQVNGLGNNFIQCLFEDKQKNIWVGTLQGLYKFDPFTEKFELTNSTKNSRIVSITQDDQEKIWFIADDVLKSFDTANGELLNYPFQGYVNPTCLLYLNHRLYLGTNNGYLKQYNSKNNNFFEYNAFTEIVTPSGRGIEKLYASTNDEIIIGTSHAGALSFSVSQKTFKQLISRDKNGNSIYVRDITQNGDELWFATESGIYIYNTISKETHNLRREFNNPFSLSDNALYSVYRDKEGGIWIGSYFKGINYYYPAAKAIHNYYPDGKSNSLKGSSIREIVKDISGNLWIGTEDAGLQLFNPDNQTFMSYLNIVNSTNIHGLLVLGNEIWVGTFDNGIFVLDAKSRKVKKHLTHANGSGLNNDFVEVITQLKSGEVIVGTASGVMKYNSDNEQFSIYDGLPNYHHYTAIVEDQEGNIWGGTLRDGMFLRTKKTRQLVSYTSYENSKNSISSNYINNVFEDKDHRIWICTEDGLNRYNKKENTFKVFGKDGEFSSSVFYSMVQDGRGTLWVSTANGISSFDREFTKINHYKKNDGLLANQFNYRSAFYDKNDDRVYFGSINGLNTFHPNAFKSQKFEGKVVITGMQVNNKEINLNGNAEGRNYANYVVLSHNQGTFSIEFSALSFKSPGLTKYVYKLEGADKEWTLLQSNRKAYFTNMASGEYVFQVKAGITSREFSPYVTKFKIIIQPPFYLTKIAYSTYFFLTLLVIVFSLSAYKKRLENKNKRKMQIFENEMEKEIYQSKIEFFTHITHEIRTPLTLIKGPIEEMFKHTNSPQLLLQNLNIVDKNTDRLLSLTNELLDFRSTEKNQFQLNFVKTNVCNLLKDNYHRFKGAAEKKQVDFQLLNIEKDFFAFADPEALNKIIGNLIDNAIKYGSKKVVVSLETYLKPNFFRINVSNDGTPIPTHLRNKLFEPFFRLGSNEGISGTGLGLSMAFSLAQLHEGNLQVDSNGGLNTFILDLPLHHHIEFGKEKQIEYDLSEEENNEEPATQKLLPQILVVDDNPEILVFLSNILSRSYRVHKSLSVKEAFEIQKKYVIGIIISDVMMPEVDGYQFCRQLKENLQTAHIPLILLTAKSALQSKIAGLDSGADAYIEKPFSPDYLLSQIGALINNRERIKSFYASSPSVHLKSIAFNKTDKEFLDKITSVVETNIKSNLLDVDFIAGEMNMSRPTLYRKIKAISNLSPHELILITRLKKAAELLIECNYRIYEVADKTGFSSQSQFTRSFTKQFNCTPSDYVNQLKKS